MYYMKTLATRRATVNLLSQPLPDADVVVGHSSSMLIVQPVELVPAAVQIIIHLTNSIQVAFLKLIFAFIRF